MEINFKELAGQGKTIGDLQACDHLHKDEPENAICEDCGKPWASEYHMSDECVKETGE